MILELRRFHQGEVGKLLNYEDLGHPGTFYVKQPEICSKLSEDSIDRLWLVVRSLGNKQGRYVSIQSPSIMLGLRSLKVRCNKVWATEVQG